MVAPVRIAWGNLTIGEWSGIVRDSIRSTLPQTFAYAQAMLLTERQKSVIGVVERHDRPIGVVLGLRRKVMGMAEHVSIHRGPLLVEEARTPEVMAATLHQVRQHFPPGLTRWMVFTPELPATEASFEMLRQARFRRTDGPGYRTAWLDLRKDEAQLRKNLRQKWRNRLNVAERAEAEGRLSVVMDLQARSLPELIHRYDADRKARGYRGPSGPLLVRLRNGLQQTGEAILLTAHIDDRLAAGILVLCHGMSATYQIGWTGLDGRQASATHLLLWRAVLHLRAKGYRWLDLGGLDPDRAPGVTLFKRGLGGEEVELAGTWV
ncbi:MAG TPA: GNAT family N-acetyltransferase [Azospirillaceae bacterium]|nr:GNAT family N-acetyltransferase [Azospirillaceae bacterium]